MSKRRFPKIQDNVFLKDLICPQLAPSVKLIKDEMITLNRILNISRRSGSIICVVAASVILVGGLLRPLSSDNWVYQTLGWDLYAYGRVPCAGNWSHNVPGAAYLHALSIALLGPSDLAFRVFDLIIEIAIALLLYKLLVRWFKPPFALLSAIIYPLLYVSLGSSVAGQPDAFAVFFLLLGIEFFFGAMEKIPSYKVNVLVLGAGFFTAACSVFRPTYGLFPLVIAISYILLNRPVDRLLWWYVVGCFSAFVALVLPFLLIPNGVASFYHAVILFNLDIYSGYAAPISVLFDALQPPGHLIALYVIAGIVAAGISLRSGKRNYVVNHIPKFVMLLYLSLVLSSIASLLVMRKFFPSHFLPFLALLSPVIAHGLLAPMLLRWKWIAVPVTICSVLYLTYRLYPRHLWGLYRTASASSMPVLQYAYNIVDTDPLTGPYAENIAAAYLKRVDTNRARVEVLAVSRPYLRVKAGLESATRFICLEPLLPRDNTFTSFQKKWREEYVDSLREVRPKFVVFADNLLRIWSSKGPFALAGEIPGLSKFLEQNYQLDTVIRGFTFYRLNEK